MPKLSKPPEIIPGSHAGCAIQRLTKASFSAAQTFHTNRIAAQPASPPCWLPLWRGFLPLFSLFVPPIPGATTIVTALLLWAPILCDLRFAQGMASRWIGRIKGLGLLKPDCLTTIHLASIKDKQTSRAYHQAAWCRQTVN